jgi:molybdate transport system substrate-binding protein
VPTGALLVNQLRAGALDAVIAYISNAKAAGDELAAIPIDIPCAIAVQPIALSKDARYPRLTRRLLERLQSPQSRERFESSGFHWNQAAPK